MRATRARAPLASHLIIFALARTPIRVPGSLGTDTVTLLFDDRYRRRLRLLFAGGP
jgi:hypothetical protein